MSFSLQLCHQNLIIRTKKIYEDVGGDSYEEDSLKNKAEDVVPIVLYEGGKFFKWYCLGYVNLKCSLLALSQYVLSQK